MTHSQHILVVDDDQDIRELLSTFFTKNGFQISTLSSGERLLELLAKTPIDIILLDVMLPGNDGFGLCRMVREKHRIPIIMLTAVSEETDKIIGLELGADDYLTKPFNPRELLARIKAVFRRINETPSNEQTLDSEQYEFSGWTLNEASRQLFSPEKLEVALSAGEYELLMAFIKHPRRVLSRDFLLDYTKNRDAGPYDRSIDVLVSRLRQKIEEVPKEPTLIKTIRAGGYFFSESVSRTVDYAKS